MTAQIGAKQSKFELKLPMVTGCAVKMRDATEPVPWWTQIHQGVLRVRTAAKSVQVLSA